MSDEKKPEALPIDPFNMYEVAKVSDRVLKIKRVLEESGFEVEVKTNVHVDFTVDIKEPKKPKRKPE